MIVYRLTSGQFSNDLSGNGAKLYGGRWNSFGLPALYTTEHISLAMLEMLVHVKAYQSPLNYKLVTLEIPEAASVVSVDYKKMKKNWRDDPGYSQSMGDAFLTERQSLVLKVPSAIVETENNFIINPAHRDLDKIKIRQSDNFIFDKRLYLTNE
jgi:RES domain-containing protein